MSVNIYDKDAGTLTALASGQRIWVGTQVAYKAAKQAGILPNNAIIAITDDEQDHNRYSTEETETGMYWIDGKPIYRKVLQTTMPTVETDGTYVLTAVPHGLQGVKDLISLDAVACSYYQSGSLHYGIKGNAAWGLTNDVTYSVYTQYNGANITIGSNRTTLNNWKVFITLEYTKTTD